MSNSTRLDVDRGGVARAGGLWGLGPYGTGMYLAPDSIGKQFEVDGWSDPYSKRGMNQVMAGIEAQKQQGRKTIAESTARACP